MAKIMPVFFEIQSFFGCYFLFSKWMCLIFTCLDVSRGNKLKLMLQKRQGKQRDSKVLSLIFPLRQLLSVKVLSL